MMVKIYGAITYDNGSESLPRLIQEVPWDEWSIGSVVKSTPPVSWGQPSPRCLEPEGVN